MSIDIHFDDHFQSKLKKEVCLFSSIIAAALAGNLGSNRERTQFTKLYDVRQEPFSTWTTIKTHAHISKIGSHLENILVFKVAGKDVNFRYRRNAETTKELRF